MKEPLIETPTRNQQAAADGHACPIPSPPASPRSAAPSDHLVTDSDDDDLWLPRAASGAPSHPPAAATAGSARPSAPAAAAITPAPQVPARAPPPAGPGPCAGDSANLARFGLHVGASLALGETAHYWRQGENGQAYRGSCRNAGDVVDGVGSFTFAARAEAEPWAGAVTMAGAWCAVGGHLSGSGAGAPVDAQAAGAWHYTGSWRDGLPDGPGLLVRADGSSYDGGWRDGRPHGAGVRVAADGARYDGGWRDGLPHGSGGLWHDAHDVTYDGEFRNGERHGQGRLTGPAGRTYEGGWRGGAMDGHGILREASGDVYEGGFRDGLRHGHGRQTWAGGGAYEGSFSAGSMHGWGSRVLADGRHYTGEFWRDLEQGLGQLALGTQAIFAGNLEGGLNAGRGTLGLPGGGMYVGDLCGGELSGHGEQTLPDGEVYEGEFVAGRRCGHGSLLLASGERYTGQFLDGQRAGRGSARLTDGSVYDGDYAADERHGQGTLTDPDGAVYVGPFVAGLAAGQGRLTRSDGDVLTGRFARGELRRGAVACANGNIYEGELVGGRYHGRGVLTVPGVSSYTGAFAAGLYHGQGVLTLASGEVRTGLYDSGEWSREGSITTPSGLTQTGAFSQHMVLLRGEGSEARTLGGRRLRYSGAFVDSRWNGVGRLEGENGVDLVIPAHVAGLGRAFLTSWQQNRFRAEAFFEDAVLHGRGCRLDVYNRAERSSRDVLGPAFTFKGRMRHGLPGPSGELIVIEPHGSFEAFPSQEEFRIGFFSSPEDFEIVVATKTSYEGPFCDGVMHGQMTCRISKIHYAGSAGMYPLNKCHVVERADPTASIVTFRHGARVYDV